MFLVNWIVCRSLNNAINVWLIEIWKQKSSSVLQLCHFMFGVGAIFGPLIDKPYLTGEQDLDLRNQTYILDSNLTIINNNKTLCHYSLSMKVRENRNLRHYSLSVESYK